MAINNEILNYGSFVPTTYIVDVQQLYQVNVNSPQFKELLVRLYQTVNALSISMNTRLAGYFVQQEFVTGALFYPSTGNQAENYRQEFMMVVNVGALPNATEKMIAHGIAGITSSFTFTQIYGCASDTTDMLYIPIPYSSPTLDKNIEISVDNTYVYITTAIDYSAYTNTYVILKYLKN